MIQGHKMILAPDGRYPSPDMVVDKYEQATTNLFRQLIHPGMMVVDVGANIGYFTLLAAELVGSTGIVYAFEPEPDNYALLKKNIQLNSYTNIQPIETAVSDECGAIQLYLSAMDNGSHSIFGAAARGVATTKTVAATTLDGFLEGEGWPNIDLVKIDVEGAENRVLDGMEQLCERSPKLNLIIEYCPALIQATGANPHDLLDRLAAMKLAVRFIDEKNGVLPPEASDPTVITEKLLKQENYINLLCSRK
jgi:FkbM family methyltransferase